MFIFLDETGNLTKDRNKFFIVGSYTVGNHRRIRKAFLKWRASKFPKRLRHLAELKFSDKRISEDLRLKTVKSLADQDVRVFYTYLRKANIPHSYWDKKRGLDAGRLYAELVAATLDLYLPSTESSFRVFTISGGLRDYQKEILSAPWFPTLRRISLPRFCLKFKRLTPPQCPKCRLPIGYVAPWVDTTKVSATGKDIMRFYKETSWGSRSFLNPVVPIN